MINKKFTHFMEHSFDLTHKTEYLGKILWNRIIYAIATNRINNSKKFVNEFSDIIYPDDCKNSLSLENFFKLREYTK